MRSRLLFLSGAVLGCVAVLGVSARAAADVQVNQLATDGTGTVSQAVSTDCIIRTFDTKLSLQKDASLDVLERLGVDCGDLAGKHGIFRVLPLSAPRQAGHYDVTAVTLHSIADENGAPYQNQTIFENGTVTWKIGDPNVTITGLHTYVIDYRVKNTVEAVGGLDQLYWNLNGAYWQLPIEQFSAQVILPEGLSRSQVAASVSGAGAPSLEWADDRTITVQATASLAAESGMTLLAKFPTGTVTPYQPTWFDLNGRYLWYVLAAAFVLAGYLLWLGFGRDPQVNKVEMVQYAPPRDLAPLEVAMMDRSGSLCGTAMTATIIDLAVKGYLTVTEAAPSGLAGLVGGKDYEFTLLKNDMGALKPFERAVLISLFSPLLRAEELKFRGGWKVWDDVKMIFQNADPAGYGLAPQMKVRASGLRQVLPYAVQRIGKDMRASLAENGYLDGQSFRARTLFLTLGLILILLGYGAAAFSWVGQLQLPLPADCFISGGISLVAVILFGVLMSRRTPEGAQLEWEISGFRKYMETAEEHRMQFYEQENMLEKYLPYAIVFGITERWIKAMRTLYADKYPDTYHPVWFVGDFSHGFSMESFTANLATVTSQVSSSAGGGMGGGGGGGGGSW